MGSITYSIAARSSTQAEIIKLSGWAGAASGALSIRWDGDGDLKGGTVIGAGGAKGEGEMDAEADATVSGAGAGRRDTAVTDADLDLRERMLSPVERGGKYLPEETLTSRLFLTKTRRLPLTATRRDHLDRA